MSREERHRIQAEKIGCMDERSVLIKMADRIYNLSDFMRDAPSMIKEGKINIEILNVRLSSYIEIR